MLLSTTIIQGRQKKAAGGKENVRFRRELYEINFLV
jgi:hypothetical protein